MICKIYKTRNEFGSPQLICEANLLVLPREGDRIAFVASKDYTRDFRGKVLEVEHVVYEGGIGGDFNLIIELNEAGSI